MTPRLREYYREEIRPKLHKQFGYTNPKHFFANHVFEIDGDVAHTRSYMHGLTPHIGGLYEIEHHRTEVGWRIVNLRLMHFSSRGVSKNSKSGNGKRGRAQRD